MKIFGLPGWSGSGKTTLLLKLIPELVRNRYALATREEFELAVAIALQEMRHVGCDHRNARGVVPSI